MEDDQDDFNDLENLSFTQFTLDKINFKKVFPNLCENFFFFFSGRILDIDIEESLNFISEFNRFLMYESLLNYVLEPFYEN